MLEDHVKFIAKRIEEYKKFNIPQALNTSPYCHEYIEELRKPLEETLSFLEKLSDFLAKEQ